MSRVFHEPVVCTMAVQAKFRTGYALRILTAFCVLASRAATTEAQNEPTASTGTSPAPVNACALLSPAAVSAVTDFPANPGIRRDSGYESNGSYSSTCVWTLEREKSGTDQNGPLGGRSFVILNVMRWPDGSGLAQSFLQAFHEAAAIGEIPREPAPRDYGDAALWWGDGLAVRKGDVSFGISVFIPGITPGHPGELEERLAPEILRQLEQPAE
jgi:hypothetical protein